MGKWAPDGSIVELMNIYKLLNPVENWDKEDIEDYEYLAKDYADEEYNSFIHTYIKNEKSLFALRIGLVKYSDLREDLTLSQYIIYLIILESNIQLELFRRENSFITDLTGIPLATVEQGLKKLFKLELIYYVDEKGVTCYKKPLTHKQFKEWLNENGISEEVKNGLYSFFPQVNDKREIIVNFLFLEDMKKSIALSEEERKIIKINKRNEIKAQRIIEQSCRVLVIEIFRDQENIITYNDISRFANEKYRIQNPKLWKSMEQKLMRRNITIDDLINHLNRII